MKNKIVNITSILNKIIFLFLLFFLIISIPYSICYANSDPIKESENRCFELRFNITLSDEKMKFSVKKLLIFDLKKMV